MNVAVFSAKRYDRGFLDAANASAGHRITYFDVPLEREQPRSRRTTMPYASSLMADADVLEALARGRTRLVALRCTGFNYVDLQAAARFGLKVVRVVTYSPYSVAEHAVALLLAINRKVHRAYNQPDP